MKVRPGIRPLSWSSSRVAIRAAKPKSSHRNQVLCESRPHRLLTKSRSFSSSSSFGNAVKVIPVIICSLTLTMTCVFFVDVSDCDTHGLPCRIASRSRLYQWHVEEEANARRTHTVSSEDRLTLLFRFSLLPLTRKSHRILFQVYSSLFRIQRTTRLSDIDITLCQ